MWDGLLGILMLTFLGVILLSKIFMVHLIIAVTLILLTPVVLFGTIIDGIKILTEKWQKRHGKKQLEKSRKYINRRSR